MSQKFTVLLDLAGTLVDTAPDLMQAHNHVMKKFGYQERELSDIKKLAGGGSKAMLRKSMHEIAELSGKIKKTDEKIDKVYLEYCKKYKNLRFLIRKSGTEPLLRILVEGKDINSVKNISMKLNNTINNIVNV